MQNLLTSWTEATGNLPAGVQRAFTDALGLAAEGKIDLTWGANYGKDGKPCLVNSVAQMVSHQAVSPTDFAPDVVSLFDKINQAFDDRGISNEKDSRYVSEIAAETLLRNFAPLKEMPAVTDLIAPKVDGPHVEPTDDNLMMDWISALDAASECPPAVSDPSDEQITSLQQAIFGKQEN